jgi:hypothetical protein
LGACAISTATPPRLSYAPPSEPPTKPGSASVGQPAGLIWNQVLDRLIQSPLQIDLADPERGIIVARYSGDPEPYVTCGWILLERGGEVEQVPASGDVSFDRVMQRRGLEVNRDMRLDARLVVEVDPTGDEAAVDTTANYVLTKTVVAADRSGRQRGSTRDVVSFSAGGRGAFSKGTVCQATGALERTVLDILPRMARVQTAEIGESDGAMDAAEIGEPQPAMPTAEIGQPDDAMNAADGGEHTPGVAPAESSGSSSTVIAPSEAPSAEIAGVPPLADPETSLECPIADRIFCEVLDVTDPYRRANQERELGLAVDAIERGSPLVGESDLGFDVSLPSYDAYLTVSLFLKDGTVRHVLSGWNRRWPAHAREFVRDAGLSVDDRRNVEMVVALASDVPVFPAPRPSSETAELYLSELRQRLSELSNGGAPARIAASLIVVTPA